MEEKTDVEMNILSGVAEVKGLKGIEESMEVWPVEGEVDVSKPLKEFQRVDEFTVKQVEISNLAKILKEVVTWMH